MTQGPSSGAEARILVLAPTAKDAELTGALLGRSGIASMACSDLEQVCAELHRGASAVLLSEEALIEIQATCLVRWLSDQPPWSDLPVLILARPGADSVDLAQAMDVLGNVTVLERPMRVAALVSAVRSSLRARARQYQIRDDIAERERAEELLRDNDRRKDEFLAVLAHELRNPLAPIRNSLHVLRLTGALEPSTQQVREIMERQVEHMVRLVDDLLEVSRITRGKIELRKERVDLAAVVRSAVETSRPLIEEARHNLSVGLPEQSVSVEGDPVRLAQVLSNLLNNAAKYTDPGGKIGLVVESDGEWAVVSVRDSGTGIPPEMLPHVFDLFMQVDRHADRAQGGLGIGLTLVKSLVEMHGGNVAATSDGPGRGSQFVIRLPRKPSREEGEHPRVENGLAPTLARRRVLVIDDNRDAAESLGMLLRHLGADVRVVYSGWAALETLAAYKPAVMLLDIGMPGMDGHEVARRVRQQPEFQEVLLIALTGWGQEEDRHRSRNAGFDHHLIKPVDLNALEALLRSLEAKRP